MLRNIKNSREPAPVAPDLIRGKQGSGVGSQKSFVIILFFFLLITHHSSLITASYASERPCLNPISTVDWSFFFDKLELMTTTCVCKRDASVKVGIMSTVPEPISFIEVARKSYYFPCLDMKASDTLKMSGTNYSKQGVKKNVHYLKYPVFAILNLLLDFLCVEKFSQFDVALISELDPRQNDDQLALLFQPWKLLFANPIAAAAGFVDCVSVSTTGRPINFFPHTAGCWGSIINVTTNSPGDDPVIESALLAVKQLDLLHTNLQLWKYSNAEKLDYNAKLSGGIDTDTSCDPTPFPTIIKSQYYMNLAYPVAADAIPIGDFGLKWSLFKQYPGSEDFVWAIWRIRNCCTGFQYP